MFSVLNAWWIYKTHLQEMALSISILWM